MLKKTALLVMDDFPINWTWTSPTVVQSWLEGRTSTQYTSAKPRCNQIGQIEVQLQFDLIRLEPSRWRPCPVADWTSHRVYIWYILTHQGHKSKVGQPFCQSESENTHGFYILSLKNKPISSNWTETNPPLSTQHSSFTWCTWHRPDHFFKVWW